MQEDLYSQTQSKWSQQGFKQVEQHIFMYYIAASANWIPPSQKGIYKNMTSEEIKNILSQQNLLV